MEIIDSSSPEPKYSDRRGFLVICTAGVAGLAATAIGAEETKPESFFGEELHKEQYPHLNKLRSVTKYGKPYTVEEGNACIPAIREYIASLDERMPNIEFYEFNQACMLARVSLRFPISVASKELLEEGKEFIYAAIDLEEKLVEVCKSCSAEDAEDVAFYIALKNLRNDLLSFNNYHSAPHVWDYAAKSYERKFFTGDGPIELSEYCKEISRLHSGNAVSRRVLNSTYSRLEDSVNISTKVFLEMSPEDRYQFLQEWRISQRLLHNYLDSNSEGRGPISEEDCVRFEEWSEEKLMSPMLCNIHCLMTCNCSYGERKEIGMILANVATEKGEVNNLVRQINSLGAMPIDIMMYAQRSNRTNNNPNNLDPFASTLIDVYKSSMGDEYVADTYIPRTCSDERRNAARKQMLDNAFSIFLCALRQLNQSALTTNELVKILERMLEGLKFQKEFETDLPNLDIWGERAGLYVSMPGIEMDGKRGEISLSLFKRRIAEMRDVLIQSDESDKNNGILKQFEQRLPMAICTKYGIYSPNMQKKTFEHLKDTSDWKNGRSGFVDHFNTSLSHDAQPLRFITLMEFGFSSSEIGSKTITDECIEESVFGPRK